MVATEPNTNSKMKRLVNTSLISLKAVLFLVFGGFACIHFLNGLVPLALGLNFDEYRLINIIVPLVSIIGPLIAGPLADRLAAKNANTFGRSLRILTAVLLIITAIIYGCILAIPIVERFEPRRPLVSFGCDHDGAVVFQERCSEEEETCFHWNSEKVGSLILTNCSYTCQNPKKFESLYNPWTKGSPSPVPPTEVVSSSEDYDSYDDSSTPVPGRVRRQAPSRESGNKVADKVFVEPPHLCTKGSDGQIEKCHVYTADTERLTVEVTLRSATNQENENVSPDWCNYPLDDFQCNIPKDQAEWMPKYMKLDTCKPMVECEVLEPYDSPGSVLAESKCIKIIGDFELTYYGYFSLRLIGEIFPLAVLTLLDTAMIIATRETSTGRGEVSKQIAWGSFGWTLTLPRFHLLAYDYKEYMDIVPIIVAVAIMLFLIAALILLVATNMPLSPPEWWWHTKTGMLVYPMSAIRRYGPETFGLTLVTFIFGVFWSSIHSYMPWTHYEFNYLTTMAILPALLLLFNVDKFIEYCGHSNILIAGFAVYIIRFTGLSMADEAEWFTMVMESLESLTFGVTWITIILYMRHIVPRKFTATGQAIAVIAHFCLGKSIGTVIGLTIDEDHKSSKSVMFIALTTAACIISLVYFILYHLIFAPRCVARAQPPPPITSQPQPTNGHGSPTNGANGNYTPLRVYHNERGKKGQFRY